MDGPLPGQAFTKRLWLKGVAIPDGWQLSEELTLSVATKYPDFVLIYGWFDPKWDDGQSMGALGQP